MAEILLKSKTPRKFAGQYNLKNTTDFKNGIRS